MDLNKIDVLIEAKKIGIQVPEYLLTNSKIELLEFKNTHQKIITKPIYNAMPIIINDQKKGYMYTNIVNDVVISKLPNEFFPSFFQECISKDYEIRVFYLDGNFFSSAIFSSSEDDSIDYRNKKKNKIHPVPYKLPIALEKKLNSLMRKLKLNTGSIDLIKCISGDYYFLEINPCGQYEAISTMCNYQLNKKIAEWLMN